jgi:hypothetical protein
VCDIDEARLKEYLVNGVAALRAHPEGFRGIHVQSETSYFRGYLWGIKVGLCHTVYVSCSSLPLLVQH